MQVIISNNVLKATNVYYVIYKIYTHRWYKLTDVVWHDEDSAVMLLIRFIGTMDVDLSLESEKYTGTSVVRAFFLRDDRETHVYNETLRMNQQTDPQLKCTDVTAYLIVSQDTLCLSRYHPRSNVVMHSVAFSLCVCGVWGCNFWTPWTTNLIFKPHWMHNVRPFVTDDPVTWHVSLSVYHAVVLCKNGWTDWDAVWGAYSC